MLEEEKNEVQGARQEWTIGTAVLLQGWSTEKVEEKTEWLEMSLTSVRNSHATQLWVMAHCKGWWTPEMVANPKEYRWTWRLYQQGYVSRLFLKTCRNTYYYILRRARCK